jgi:hypothetical protein
MIFRSADEFKRRAAKLGISRFPDESPSPLNDEVPFIRFSIEGLPNARIALARMLVSWFGEFRDCEFWISEFGIWPSSEDRNLYRRLRSSHGDSRELYEAPAHLFEFSEKPDLETYLGVAMLFGWGGHVVPDPLRVYLYLSHDGWLHVAAREGLGKTRSDLDEFEIEYQISGAE